MVFIAAKIAYIRFFTAVHIYDFHLFTIIIHYLDGLFGPNTYAVHIYDFHIFTIINNQEFLPLL